MARAVARYSAANTIVAANYPSCPVCSSQPPTLWQRVPCCRQTLCRNPYPRQRAFGGIRGAGADRRLLPRPPSPVRASASAGVTMPAIAARQPCATDRSVAGVREPLPLVAQPVFGYVAVSSADTGE